VGLGREKRVLGCDEIEIVLADGEFADGERDMGYMTARRVAADWRGCFAGSSRA
jgi:hypothetical protein